MTIKATVRSRFGDEAQAHGWVRRSFGTGYCTDEYSRGNDVILVQFDTQDYDRILDLQVRMLGEHQVGLDGQPVLTKVSHSDTPHGYHEALHIMRIDPRVRRLRWLEAAYFNGDDGAIDDPVPHEIINAQLGEDEFHQDNVTGVWLRVGKFEDGFTVWWSDGVANDWCEWFPALSSAMALVAVLMYCGEENWDVGFAHTGPEMAYAFNQRAQRCLSQEVK